MAKKEFMERPEELDNPFVKKMIRRYSLANVWLFKKTGGRLGNKWRIGAGFPWGAPVALLTTIGRKSGEERTAPLIYGKDGRNVVVIASQGGMRNNPLWYLNIKKNPSVKVQTGKRPEPYVARIAEGEERARLWKMMCGIYADYDQYQYWTDREIPVVVCEPTS